MSIYGDKECEDVYVFHKKFGFKVSDKPELPDIMYLKDRIAMMDEELDEFTVAVMDGKFCEMADALIDLVYFIKGTAVAMGLPWGKLWNDVNRANMAKVRGIGPRGIEQDCIKPAGWEGPHTAKILWEASACNSPKK